MKLSKDYNGLVVIIPTRNRSDLAMNAIQSVLQQPLENLHVIVSDNSTTEEHRISLAAFCKQVADSRLILMRPPKPLLMSEHWDWVMKQALDQRNASHFIYLADRSIFKPGVLHDISELARKDPDKVIAYDFVTIFDHRSPIMVAQQLQTGRVFEVSAAHLLSLCSRSIFPPCLPRMINCCVPRSVIQNMQERYGSVFASISPDYNFCYRCLEMVDSILYYDCAAYVGYGLPRSNGVEFIGIKNEATIDFNARVKESHRWRYYAAPIPAFKTIVNAHAHEYCLVKSETGNNKFPNIRRFTYIVRNAERPLAAFAFRSPVSLLSGLVSLRTRVQKILRFRSPAIADYERYRTFQSVSEAINYAVSVAPHTDSFAPHLSLLRVNK